MAKSLNNFLPTSFLPDSGLLKSLGDEFVFCENGNMVFHWADFHETCKLMKQQLLSDPKLLADFNQREGELQRLKLIPVWIRTQAKLFQLTMFELYEKSILHQLPNLMGLDPYGPLEISFISGTGPFKAMAIAECFNHLTYRDFILVYLLQDKLPKRDFRIRVKSKILFEYGAEFHAARLVGLEQLTSQGLLFSVDSEFFQRELSGQDQIRLLIDTHLLHEVLNLPLSELKDKLAQHTFNLLYSSRKEDAIEVSMKQVASCSSFDFLKNKKVFLFISFEALGAEKNSRTRHLLDFVAYSKELIRKHYVQDPLKFKTA